MQIELGFEIPKRQRLTFDLIESRIDVDEDGCWIWKGAKTDKGYGKVFGLFHGRYQTYRAHRISWQLFHGQIPDDKPHILHSCHNPSCVNPMHLRPGTNAENVQDRVNRRSEQCHQH